MTTPLPQDDDDAAAARVRVRGGSLRAVAAIGECSADAIRLLLGGGRRGVGRSGRTN